MEMDSGHKLGELAVDGGMSNSDICMQVCTAPPISPIRMLTHHLRPNQTKSKSLSNDPPCTKPQP